MPKTDSTVLARWLIARRITLGAIVVAGTMSTAAALTCRLAEQPCGMARAGVYTYSGIGVELTRDGDDFVVERVFPGTPADGVIYPGAILLGVDGDSPDTMRGWTRSIRGEAGTSVELDVVYPCSGHETVELERAMIQLAY